MAMMIASAFNVSQLPEYIKPSRFLDPDTRHEYFFNLDLEEGNTYLVI